MKKYDKINIEENKF